MSTSSIAVVVAHADDAELWAGGTLLNHRDIGDALGIWYLHCPDEPRRREARCAAAIIGALVHFPENDADLLQMLVAFRPDALITHWEGDSHPEHSRVFDAVRHIFPSLAVTHGAWPSVYSCDTYNSVGREADNTFEPTDVIDVSANWLRKLELLKEYVTQPTEYFSAMLERQARTHGARTGVEFAEGFRQVPLLGRAVRHRQLLIV